MKLSLAQRCLVFDKLLEKLHEMHIIGYTRKFTFLLAFITEFVTRNIPLEYKTIFTKKNIVNCNSFYYFNFQYR